MKTELRQVTSQTDAKFELEVTYSINNINPNELWGKDWFQNTLDGAEVFEDEFEKRIVLTATDSNGNTLNTVVIVKSL